MTDRELPDFDPILREISTVIDALMAASTARAQRGQQHDAMRVVIVADALDMARDMIHFSHPAHPEERAA